MPSSPNDTEITWNNYKIPKAKEESESSEMAWKGAKESFPYQAPATPLADSYYNYPYDPNAAGAYYHNQQSGFQYGNQTGEGVKITAAGPLATGGNFHQKVLDALQHREKPKNVSKNVFHEIVPDLQDNSLPKDLKLLFQPLFCKLCSAKLSSNMTAKMHYKSKNHEKKLRKWLVEYAEKSGEPLHPRAHSNGDKNGEGSESNPNWFHCQVCDLQLTGRLHAESHYMGRNHQRAVLGHKTPAGQGYYDTSGKWVRIKSVKTKSMNFEAGEDNFGKQFKRSGDEEPTTPPAKKRKDSQTEQFRCEICGINTTCNEQLQSHYMGQKHAKKLKSIAATTDPSTLGLSHLGMMVLPQNQVMAVPIAVPTAADLTGDLSVYRTPSGSYYCPTCNLTTNSELQFRQHLTSKNHAKKALQANITDK